MFFQWRSRLSRSLKSTSQKCSSHSFHSSARRQTVCRCDPLSPPEGRVQNLLLSSLFPVRCGSGDNLWLPGLTGHLGATLRYDRWACWGLTVEAQAADQVLQSRAIGLPPLQRGRGNRIHLCQFYRQLRRLCTLSDFCYSLLINAPAQEAHVRSEQCTEANVDNSNHSNDWLAELTVEKSEYSQLPELHTRKKQFVLADKTFCAPFVTEHYSSTGEQMYCNVLLRVWTLLETCEWSKRTAQQNIKHFKVEMLLICLSKESE